MVAISAFVGRRALKQGRGCDVVPYIRVIDEDEAEGPLFKLYDEIQSKRGRLSNVLKIQSLDPKGLEAHLDLYMALVFGKGPLSRRERELIAVVVSSANGCEYCYTHHGEALNKYVKDDAFIQQAIKDYTQLDLPAGERALCDYAVGLTKTPGEGRSDAVEALRAAGFDDEAILQATSITAYFNFVNRMVHGLGVELEGDDARDYDY